MSIDPVDFLGIFRKSFTRHLTLRVIRPYTDFMLTLTMPKKEPAKETAAEKHFRETLRKLRTEAGLTQAVLAERSGLAADTIRQFESGRRTPGFDTLANLAAGLGVSLSAFDPPSDEPKRKGKK